jgi:hemolysin activation/secretion protein
VSIARKRRGSLFAYTLGSALACSFGPAGSSLAQVFAPFERPGDIRREIPEPAPEKRPEFTLPPLPAPPAGDLPLSQQARVEVRAFQVTGSTVLSDAELARVTAPYLGRALGAEDLERLRQQLTLLYVDAGYLNSGAVLPDQDVRDGVIHYQIVEGRLAEVDVKGNRWFRGGYLRSRILRGAHTPLNVRDLEQELQIIQQDPRIRRVDAELLPGERPGEARLRASFDEELPFFASLESSNHDSPSVGEYRIQLDLADRNLSGWGDVLHLMGAWTQGLWDTEAGYEIPVTPWDTALGAWFRWGTSDVVEEPFDELDITSRAHTIGLELRQPVYRTERSSFDLALTAEHRESKTFLLGEPFPFEEGTDDGRVVVSVLRLRQDWLYRDLQQVVAVRSQLSIGVDVLGATNDGCAFDLTGLCTPSGGTDGGAIPDAHFVAWLGQFQWVRRFDRWWGIEAVFRTDLQLASQPLFSLEQFSVGGHQSVRGYRENQLVRDNGLASSLELRIPLWSQAALGIDVQLAPFCDVGRSWNTKRGEASPRTLASVGVGLRASYSRHLRGEIYWGHRLRHVDEPEDHGLQDEGVQFAIVASF